MEGWEYGCPLLLGWGVSLVDLSAGKWGLSGYLLYLLTSSNIMERPLYAKPMCLLLSRWYHRFSVPGVTCVAIIII